MLTFIAEYPNEENTRDGMMIRIKEIDDKFAHLDRNYLDISFFRARKNNGKPNCINPQLTIYHYNFFLNFLDIYKILKQSNKIYVQALYNYVKVLLFLNLFLKKKEVAIDLHGAIPEELSYQKSSWYAIFYNWIEKAAFIRCQYFIHVTFAMSKHFLLKYPLNRRAANSMDFVLGIFTSYDSEIDPAILKKVKEELNWTENDVWFIYSGGVQDWQNVPLVLKTIKDLTNPNYRFLILTGQPIVVLNWMKEAQIDTNKIIVKSVSPNQLKEYYFLSNYGFVLRNPDVVNRVSNPTKLGEYLAYGMVPIVIDPNIGDYLEMGFEYVPLNKINNQMEKVNSDHNRNIYSKYINSMQKVRLPFI